MYPVRYGGPAPAPARPVGVPASIRKFACVYALHGGCKDSKCSNAHDGATLSAVPLCRFHIRSGQPEEEGCSFGNRCRYVHGTPCPNCGANVIHAFDHAANNHHLDSCSPPPPPPGLDTTADKCVPSFDYSLPAGYGGALLTPDAEPFIHTSAEVGKGKARTEVVECSICFESVEGKGVMYGLLASCSHPFCLECIRSWRTTSSLKTGVDQVALRSCPVCRAVSTHVVPSREWPSSDARKREIVAGYLDSRKGIRCKHFEKSGYRRCPFGDSCFYSHSRPDGTVPTLGPPRVTIDGANRMPMRYRGRGGTLPEVLRGLSAYLGRDFEGEDWWNRVQETIFRMGDMSADDDDEDNDEDDIDEYDEDEEGEEDEDEDAVYDRPPSPPLPPHSHEASSIRALAAEAGLSASDPDVAELIIRVGTSHISSPPPPSLSAPVTRSSDHSANSIFGPVGWGRFRVELDFASSAEIPRFGGDNERRDGGHGGGGAPRYYF